MDLKYIKQIFKSYMTKCKVELPPSKKFCVIYLIESPVKMMKNAFLFKFKIFEII